MSGRWGRTAALLLTGALAVAGVTGCTRSGATADRSVADQSSAQSSAQSSGPVSAPAGEPEPTDAAAPAGAGGAAEMAEAASVQAVADAADALIAQAEEAMAGDD